MARHNRATDRTRKGFVPQRPKHTRQGAGTYYVPSITVVQCPTGKRGFSEQVAQAKLDAYAEGANNRTFRPVRIYYHELCDSWHLTSQETYP